MRTDPVQMQQLLLDLALNALNARDAMRGGGQLTIETARTVVEASGRAASENAGIPEGALVAASGTLQGMDDVTKSRIFEAFFTTQSVDEGCGLGLTAVHDT